MRQKRRRSAVSTIAISAAGQLHRRARSPAPVLAPLKPRGDGKAVVPVRRVRPATVGDETRLRSSEFAAAPRVQL